VAVDIHRDADAGMTQLLLDIARALVGHQEDRGIIVPQVVRVANPELRGLADPLHQRLDIALTIRPSTLSNTKGFVRLILAKPFVLV